MNRLGLVPCAGLGNRWHMPPGFRKELLPVAYGKTALDHSIEALHLAGCDPVVVVRRPGQLPAVDDTMHHGDVLFAYQTNFGSDLFGAWSVAFRYDPDETLVSMPDTIYPVDAWDAMPRIEGLSLGVFETSTPERFGCLTQGEAAHSRIVDKPAPDHPDVLECRAAGEPFLAWGLVAWDRDIMDLWRTWAPENQTAALNLALSNCFLRDIPPQIWLVERYADLVDFDAYRRFLCSSANMVSTD